MKDNVLIGARFKNVPSYVCILDGVINIDGLGSGATGVTTTGADATVYLAKTVSVPADATLVVIDKNMGLYLMESDILKIQASAAGDLSAVCSYEEIDDA